jgi:hypothetical protein
MVDRGWPAAIAFAFLLGACSFDSGGVADDEADASNEPDASEETDGDGDGVVDAADNCPELANSGQEDEDADDVGNVCDNCPHVSNADQANASETAAGVAADGAGDACDPDPGAAGNDILYFEGFDDPNSRDDWRAQGGGAWSVSAGALRQTSTSAVHTLYSVAASFEGGIFETRVTVDDLPASTGPSDTNRGVASIVSFAPGAGNGNGYLCLLFTNPRVLSSGIITLATMIGGQPSQTEASLSLGTDLQEGATYDLETSVDTPSGALRCASESTTLAGPVEVTATDTTYASGFIGFRTQYVAAHYDYVVVFGQSD